MTSRFVAVTALLLAAPLHALDGQPAMHDPSTVVVQDARFYSYGTGRSLPISLLDLGDGVQKFSCHDEADLDRGGIRVLDIRPLLWRDSCPMAGKNFSEGVYQIESARTGTALELAVEGINGGGATDFCARLLDADERPVRSVAIALPVTRQ